MNAPEQHPPAVRTTCPYCGVGCGILAKPDGQGGAEIAGDPEHPANFGRLCSKGSALGETLALESRLLHPMIRSRVPLLQRIIGCSKRLSIARVSPSAEPFEHSRPKLAGCSGSPAIAAPPRASGVASTPQ